MDRSGRGGEDAGTRPGTAPGGTRSAGGPEPAGRGSALREAQLGPLTLRNRILKAATFEGVTPHGVVTPELVAFHERVARGGAALSTVAYLAVSPEGRTDRHCVLLGDDTIAGLRRVTDAVHAAGAAAAAQIGHAGPVANGRSNRAAVLAPSGGLTPVGSRTRGASDADIARITEAFGRGASVARKAGFDAVEVHLGHNYLLSAFLSPHLNRRTDRWGGSLDRRARFPLQVVREVRNAVGPRLAVTVKLNMADGVPGGFWLDESVEFARMLEGDGAVDAITLTGGSSLANPMFLFRGEVPRREFAATLPVPLRLGFRAFGGRFLREYPFEEAFFLPYARQFLDALDVPLVLLGGINRLDTVEAAIGEGFSFVAMARALLRQPDLVNRFLQGAVDEGLCVHCNRCMPTIYRGTRCVLA